MNLCDLTTIFHHYLWINVFTHFVDERKFDVQSVCDCCHPLCPSSVWTHYDCVPENGITLRLDEGVKKTQTTSSLRCSPWSTWGRRAPRTSCRRGCRRSPGSGSRAGPSWLCGLPRTPGELLSVLLWLFLCLVWYFVLLVGLLVHFSWLVGSWNSVWLPRACWPRAWQRSEREICPSCPACTMHMSPCFFLSVFVICCAF